MGTSFTSHLGFRYEMKDGTSWRVISERYGENVHLIRMNVSRIEYKSFDYDEFCKDIELGIYRISEDQEIRTIDPAMLTKEGRANYLENKKFIDEFNKLYSPSYVLFLQHTRKDEFIALTKECGFSKSKAYRIARKYLQSGMQNSSLCRIPLKGVKRNYENKPGRPSSYNGGKLITNEDVKYMDEAIAEYRRNRLMSQEEAYRLLVLHHYSTEENGRKIAFSADKRPTKDQFRYRLKQLMSKEDIQKKKTSAKEYRNNERLLLGTTRMEGAFPGSSVEVDTLEMKLEIIAEKTDANSNIGKPIIYLMVDRYTHCITCFSIGYNNNAVLGLSDLMLNMITPKEEVLRRYGISLSEDKSIDDIMPPPFIPQEIFCDRGSDYVSKWFQGFCEENGISLSAEPGALGSYKGTVEGMFRVFERSFEARLIDKGVIQHRHDSNHEREACLTLTNVYQLAFAFVAMHNNRIMENMRLTKDMRKAELIPTPNELWKYGFKNIGSPRGIPESRRLETMFSLMQEKKASISRKGVVLNGLYYSGPDPYIQLKMKTSQYQGNQADSTGKRKNEITVRIDPRSVESIYYRDGDGAIKALELTPANSPEVKGMTWAKYYELQDIERDEKRKYREINLNNSINYLQIVDSIAGSVDASCYADIKDKKEKRKNEREQINYENNLKEKMMELTGASGQDTVPLPASEPKSVADDGTDDMDGVPELPAPEPELKKCGRSSLVNSLPAECPDFF